MDKNKDILKESSLAAKEIGEHLENTLAKKKEEAEEKVNQIKEEIDKRRETLTNFEKQIAELEKHKTDLEGKIGDHLDRAIQCQKEIEKLAESKLNELKKMEELDQKIGEHRQEAEEKTEELKQGLEEKYGVAPSMPEREVGEEDLKTNIEEELNKLRKVKELLGLAEPPQIEEEKPEEKAAEETKTEEKGMEEVPQEEEISEEIETEEKVEEEVSPEAKMPEELSPEEGTEEKEALPEILEAEEPGTEEEKKVEALEDSSREEVIFEEEPLPEAEQESETTKEDVMSQAPPEGETDLRDKMALLETLKKSETVEGEDQIIYYQGEKKTVLDGRCMFAAIDSRIQQARDLYQNLDPNSPPKDQFKIKQEIRNSQENLRKYFLRTIDMYEKESFLLPEYSSEVLNINILRDILEHLSMLNWSEEENFSFFNDRIEKIKRSFYSKITPHENYSASIHDELSA
ncbi:MAG: hypothetical protein JSV96_12540 [Candidatus Aminicenantes bacterium]|nr:MAG: hypothetical protein JSV96_12540 [Candidatus Aminicenantes bacterium]